MRRSVVAASCGRPALDQFCAGGLRRHRHHQSAAQNPASGRPEPGYRPIRAMNLSAARDDGMVKAAPDAGTVVETDIPARLDRLPWGRFQTLVVVALGITWILDGLEVTLVGALAGALKQSPVLKFSNTDVGLASSAYLAGAV